MSTPAIITKKNNPSLAIYIHFDGYSKEMIQEIVNIAKNNKARNVNDDEEYGIARLACACQEYFKNQTTGFGVCLPDKAYHDYHWVINEDWSVSQA